MVLKVQGLFKSFKGNKVLENVCFEINRGEIASVIGPSGAGKTTLLRCINGLEKCDKGEVIIKGRYIFKECQGRSVYASRKELKEIRKNISMVFQSFNLFPHMTVLQNVMEAPVHAYGTDGKSAESKALRVLERLGLKDKANAYPFELSGGQKQRAAIARACALEPDIICMDEPTSALDPSLRDEIASIINDLSRGGIAVLVISHDMDFVKKISDRIIYMENGIIAEEVRASNIDREFKKAK